MDQAVTPGPEDWGAVAEPEEAKAGPQAWGAVAAEDPQAWGATPASTVDRTGVVKHMVEPVLEAFGQGFREGWGPERLGLKDQDIAWASKVGLFQPAGSDHYTSPFYAFNELLAHVIYATPEIALRAGSGLFRGLQAAGMEAGLPRDIVALPEAFFGMPHPTGIPKGFPAVKASVVTEAAHETRAGGAPSFTATVEGSSVTAYHGSPHDFDAFSLDKIGTGEGAQSYGHGLYFAEHPEVATEYQKRLSGDKELLREKNSLALQLATTDAGHPDAIAIQRRIDEITLEQQAPRGAVYQVRINADREHFLDWDKPLSEQAPNVQEAVKRAMGIDYYGKFDSEKSQRLWDQFQHADAGVAVRQGFIAGNDAVVSQRLRDAGVPGIKYLDQGSRVDPFNEEFVRDAIKRNKADLKLTRDPAEIRSIHDEIARLEDRLEQGFAPPKQTSNFVVFDHDLIEITHKNGEPVLNPSEVAQARDLGVVGPARPPITEGAPQEAAARSVAADQKRPETITQEVGEGMTPWQERFEQFVGKLEAPGDVKQLIRDAAKENGDFVPARQGEVPLNQVEDIAAAAGMASGEINQKGLGRLLQNDQQVRAAMQMMLKVTNDVADAAREVRAGDAPENLIKLQEAIMRRDLAVEQVVGLRAEWGRTGNVFQEFLRDVKDQEGLTNFLKDKGRTPGDLRHIADALEELDGAQTARFLNDLRTPTAWDKFMYYWVNGLISGPVTHAKYVIANAVFAGYEAAVVTPVAGAIGAVRRAASGTHEGVYIGEAGARLWGIVAGVPDAIVGAARAARTGLQTALPGEVAQNIIPQQQRTIAFQQKPITGALGTAIGIPSRGASAIHSFFNFLGYRASLEAQAYRGAAKEGLRPLDTAFWERRADLVDKPTIEMMNEGIEEGYRLTFINELSPGMKKITSAVKATKIGQLALPFLHIPFNILARAIEGNPVLAGLSAETRDVLAGKNGAVKQDAAVARLVAGSALGVWAVNLVANDRMTGYGPTDPKERAQWLATGHQPYSIRIGDYWYSFNRFGPLGTMLGIHANLAEAIPHIKPDVEELTKALTMTVHATGRLLEDEVGMQGLAGLIEAINEPERKGERFVANFAGSLLPYSSLARQTASAMDPSMREAKSLVDGLRYYIPVARQGLRPKLDWLGEPIANAGYGGDIPGAPGVSAIIQHRQVGSDPLALEMTALNLHPAPPQDRIGGVKLPAKLYDQYQTTAGPLTRATLEHFVQQPGWHDMPAVVRENIFRKVIAQTRQAAAAAVQAAHPEIIQQGIKNRLDHINGVKPTKLAAPAD